MREEFKEVRRLAKKHGVKVYFKKLKYISGQCFFEEKIIHLDNTLKTRCSILSTYAHEYYHIICWEKVKMKTALKCEKWIDRNARFFLYQYDKRLVYLAAYDGDKKESRKFLQSYYESVPKKTKS